MRGTVVDVLIVEDDASDEEFTRRALLRHDVTDRVHVERDGDAALRFLFRDAAAAGDGTVTGPRCIFLDLKLPRLGGLEVLERIRADPRTATIPVIVLTSSRERCDLAEAYRLGANSYVVKPVAFDQYERVVADVGRYWLRINEAPG